MGLEALDSLDRPIYNEDYRWSLRLRFRDGITRFVSSVVDNWVTLTRSSQEKYLRFGS